MMQCELPVADIHAGKKFAFKSFKGQDLSKQDLSHGEYIHCNFTDCNMEEANCSFSIFSGSNFTGANLRYTNFARSNLQNVIFHPVDAYGVIFSMDCQTFKGMIISRLWWYSYKYFSLIQVPETEGGIDPRDADIAAMGSERYRRLCKMFESRGF